MKTNSIILFSFGLICSLLSSCAIIFKGSVRPVHITSFPSGATVAVNGVVAGKTPLTYQIVRSKQKPVITLEKSGYQPISTTVKRSLRPIVYLDFLYGMVYGGIVDIMSGYAYHYTPYTEVVLEPKVKGSKPIMKTYTKKDHFYISTYDGKFIVCQPYIHGNSVKTWYKEATTAKKMKMNTKDIKEFKDIIELEKERKFKTYYDELAKTNLLSIADSRIFTTAMYKYTFERPDKAKSKYLRPFIVALAKDSIEIRHVEFSQQAVTGNGATTAGSRYKYTYLFINDKYVETIDDDNFGSIVMRYFGDCSLVKRMNKESLLEIKNINTIGLIYRTYCGDKPRATFSDTPTF